MLSLLNKVIKWTLLPLVFISGLWLPSFSFADCALPPQLFAGESATYRFTEPDAQAIDVVVKVLEERKYEMVLQVSEGDERYMAVVHTACFDTGVPFDYEEPAFPDFYEFPKLVEILQPSTAPIRTYESYASYCSQYNEAFVDVLGKSVLLDRCILEPESGMPVEGATKVELLIMSDYQSTPMSGLLSKVITLQSTQTRTIELVKIGDTIPDDGRPLPPVLLNTEFYSDNALEITWQRPADGRAVLFEIQRNNEVVAVVDALSYYDSSLLSYSYYQYSVTAIDAQGNRSVTINIAPGIYNYGFVGEITLPDPIIYPPQFLSGRVYSETSAELFWVAQSVLDSGFFEISRDGAVVGVTDGNSYFDDTLQPGLDYRYSIVSLSESGGRSESIQTTITTPRSVDAAPPTTSVPEFIVQAEVYSSTAAELFWPDVGYGIGQRFEIYKEDRFFADTQGFSYFIDNLDSGTGYEFKVYSYDYGGDLDAQSQLITLTTLNDFDGDDTGSDLPPSEEPNIVVTGNTISWPDNGWYQVQDGSTYATLCEGGRDCVVPAGSYTVINHSSGERFENVSVDTTNSILGDVGFDEFIRGDLAFTEELTFNQPRFQILRSNEELNNLYFGSLIDSSCEACGFVPLNIDFNSSTVVLVAHEIVSSGGYNIYLETATQGPDRLSLDVVRTTPGDGCAVTAAFTGPFTLYRLDGVHTDIDFVERTVQGDACLY